jgi:hypothetical protein
MYFKSNTCLGTSLWAQGLGTHTNKKIKRKIKLSHQFTSHQSFFLYFYVFLMSVSNKYYLGLWPYKYFSYFKYVQRELVFFLSIIIYDLNGVMELFNCGIFFYLINFQVFFFFPVPLVKIDMTMHAPRVLNIICLF